MRDMSFHPGKIVGWLGFIATPRSTASDLPQTIRFEHGVWVGSTETNDQARIWKAEKTYVVTRTAECNELPQPYFTHLCALLLIPAWRDIAIPGNVVGPSSEMSARIVRAELSRDPAVCRDDLVSQYLAHAFRLAQTNVATMCEQAVSRDEAHGFIELTDPTSLFSVKTFMVRIP